MKAVRLILVVLVAAFGVAAWTQIPTRVEPDLGLAPDLAVATTVGCPVVTGRTETDASIGSPVSAIADVMAVAAGEIIRREAVVIDDSGGAELSIGDFAGSSTLGLIIDLPEAGAAVALVSRSDEILAAAQCTPPVPGEIVVAGVSSASGESLDLVLANPYSNDAVVEIRTSSEAGPDSASELESVVVAARSTRTIDLSRLLPLRTRISARIIPERGIVHVVGVQTSPVERMLVEAVAPAREWYLPIPDTGTQPVVTVAAVGPLAVDFRIDTFDAVGESVGVVAGTIAADDQFEVSGEDLGENVRAIRVSTDGLVVASVVIESETIRAGTPGVPHLSDNWLVPGTSGQDAVLRFLNPTGLPVEAVVQALVPGGTAQTVVIEPGTTTEVELGGPGAGYSVRADGEILVAWSLASDGGFALGVGTPTSGAGE